MRKFIDILLDIQEDISSDWSWFKQLANKKIARIRLQGKLLEVHLDKINSSLWNLSFSDPKNPLEDPVEKFSVSKKLELFNISLTILNTFLMDNKPKLISINTSNDYSALHRKALLNSEKHLISMGYKAKVVQDDAGLSLWVRSIG